ncbi:hypothetical protein MTO96_005553 [Rhipicephalus appendiculatus]
MSREKERSPIQDWFRTPRIEGQRTDTPSLLRCNHGDEPLGTSRRERNASGGHEEDDRGRRRSRGWKGSSCRAAVHFPVRPMRDLLRRIVILISHAREKFQQQRVFAL